MPSVDKAEQYSPTATMPAFQGLPLEAKNPTTVVAHSMDSLVKWFGLIVSKSLYRRKTISLTEAGLKEAQEFVHCPADVQGSTR
jgi:hypothetical protein